MVYGVHYVNTFSFFLFPPQDFVVFSRVVDCFSFHLFPFHFFFTKYFSFFSTHSCPLGSQRFKP